MQTGPSVASIVASCSTNTSAIDIFLADTTRVHQAVQYESGYTSSSSLSCGSYTAHLRELHRKFFFATVLRLVTSFWM